MTIRCPKCGAEHHTLKSAKLKYAKDENELRVESCVSCRVTVTCNKCGLEADKDEAPDYFDRRHGSPTGFQYACRECRAKQNRKYRTPEYKKAKEKEKKKEREKTREKSKKWHKEKDKVSRERDWQKDRFRQRMRSYISKLQNGEPLGETVRTFNFSLKVIIESQLNLMYNGIQTPAGLQKKRQIITDTLYEIQEALSRTVDRMKRVSSTGTSEIAIVDHRAERARALKVLGLPITATKEEIKERYRTLAQNAHPDHGGDADRMVEINNAWSTLEGINGCT